MRFPLILLAILLVTTACTPVTSIMPTGTPTIGPLLPTVVVLPQHVSETKTINEITFTEPELSLQNGKVVAKICYIWPGEGLWELGKTVLKYQESELPLESSQEISIEPVTSPLPARIRCVENKYTNIPEKLAPLNLKLEVEWVNLSPLPEKGQACEMYQARLKNSLDIQNAAIEVTCIETGEFPEIEITHKIDDISLARAKDLVWRVVGLVRGPWVFEMTIP